MEAYNLFYVIILIQLSYSNIMVNTYLYQYRQFKYVNNKVNYISKGGYKNV